MTWTTWAKRGGESQEDLIELVDCGADVSLSNAVTITGARVFDLDADGVGKSYNISTGLGYFNNRITAYGFGIYLTASPTAAFPLLYDATGGTAVLTIDTDRKLNLYNSTPALLAGPSTAIPLNTATWGVLFIDPLTVGTSNVWAVLILAGNEEWALDIGAPGWSSPAWTWGQAGGPDYGTHVYLDDLVTRTSADTAEAPHQAAYPKLRVDTAFPNGEFGAPDQDWLDQDDNIATYDEWDETGGHDGDTTYNYTTGGAVKRQQSYFEDAAELGWGANAVPYNPGIWTIHKATGGSKFKGQLLWEVSGTGIFGDYDTSGPGTSWVRGGEANLSRPGGGSWARGDLANFSAGAGCDASVHDKKWWISLFVTEWLYENDSTSRLPTATGPAVAVGPVGSPTLMGASVGIF